jgi:hypothetical protein
MFKKWISPMVVLVVVVIGVALVPAASHAAIKRGVKKPVFKAGQVARVYVDGTSSDNDFLCLLHEDAINKSLSQANDAVKNGEYGQVPGYLNEAAAMAADAIKKGCKVKF